MREYSVTVTTHLCRKHYVSGSFVGRCNVRNSGNIRIVYSSDMLMM